MENEDLNNEKLPDFLAKMKGQKEGYEVPFNYFQNLENNVMDKIYQENRAAELETQKPTIWQRLFSNKVPALTMGLAAILLITIGLNWNTEAESYNINDMNAETAALYIEDNIEAFSYDMITEDILEETMDDLDESAEMYDDSDVPEEYWDEIDEEDLDEYL